MIRKIFKLILVLNLCLGVTLPSNAAISVSDGSAFVTKAEFSADLNNLSNRMAQLENSLDAKIDSLVSSYLTRNGIWNGAKQTLTNTSGITFRYGLSRGISLSKDRLNVAMAWSDRGYWDKGSASIGEIVVYNSKRTVDVINDISKSGMIVFQTYLQNYRQSAQTRCAYTYAPLNETPGTTSYSTNANGDHFAFIYSQDFIYYINGSVEGGRTHAEFIAVASCAALRCPAVPAGTMIFFVSKGDKITVKDDWVFKKGDYTSYAASLCWFDYGDGSYTTYDYVIKEANVY